MLLTLASFGAICVHPLLPSVFLFVTVALVALTILTVIFVITFSRVGIAGIKSTGFRTLVLHNVSPAGALSLAALVLTSPASFPRVPQACRFCRGRGFAGGRGGGLFVVYRQPI